MSTTPVADVSVGITADDKTAKGVKSAEKRLGGLGKTAAKVGGDTRKIGEGRGLTAFGKSLVEVERSASRAFGVSSPLGSLAARVGAIKKIGSSLGTSFGQASVELGEAAVAGQAAGVGLGEAATGAGALVAAMGPVAVVGAAAIVTLGAAAVAGYKFASGWAAGTAQMGRFAETIGISAQALQQFQGAAARYGIGKDATDSSLAAFSQNVHDARYGRNNDTLALMTRLGVKFRSKADGTLDYTNMLGDTADALARQKDPQTALMIANHLGIAGMLPMLRKGRATVAGDMGDVARHGVNLSDRAISDAQRFNRDSVVLGQMVDRKKQAAQAWTAEKYAPVMDRGIDLGRSAMDGRITVGAAKAIGDGAASFGRSVVADFVPAAKKIGEAASALLEGSADAATRHRRTAPPQAPQDGAIQNAAELGRRIERLGERSRQNQISPAGAVGVMQVMPATARAVARRHGVAFDDHQYRTDARFNRRLGQLYVDDLWHEFGGDPALAAAAYNAGPGRVRAWIRRNGDPRDGRISDAAWADLIPNGQHSGSETRDYVHRVIGEEHRVVHVHEFHGLPAGSRVRSQTRGSPAVSMSMGD